MRESLKKIGEVAVSNLLLALLYFLVSWPSYAQSQTGPSLIKSETLLDNMQLQIEITEAVNSMYNFKHDEASIAFNALKYRYGWHPLPYFLLGLNEWWKIVNGSTGESVKICMPYRQWNLNFRFPAQPV